MPQPTQQRLPNLAKVAIAILEAKVEAVIGKDAVKEIKTPFQLSELADSLTETTIRAEARLVAKYPESEVVVALRACKRITPHFNNLSQVHANCGRMV